MKPRFLKDNLGLHANPVTSGTDVFDEVLHGLMLSHFCDGRNRFLATVKPYASRLQVSHV